MYFEKNLLILFLLRCRLTHTHVHTWDRRWRWRWRWLDVWSTKEVSRLWSTPSIFSLFFVLSVCVYLTLCFLSFFLLDCLYVCDFFSFFVHKSKIVTFCFYVVYFINYPVVSIQTFCDVNLSVFYFQHSLSLQLCLFSFSSFHFVVDT